MFKPPPRLRLRLVPRLRLPAPALEPEPVDASRWLARPPLRHPHQAHWHSLLAVGGGITIIMVLSVAAMRSFWLSPVPAALGLPVSPPAMQGVEQTNPYLFPAATPLTPATVTPTALPMPTWTVTPLAATTPAGMATPTPLPAWCGSQVPSICVQCPPQWTPGPAYTTKQLMAFVQAAATAYALPVALVSAEAHDESSFDPYAVNCSSPGSPDYGLLQLHLSIVSDLNALAVPACDLTATSYDVFDLPQNVLLGAKLLSWIHCQFLFFSGFPTDDTATAYYSTGMPTMPGPYSAMWYYHQARRMWPDTNLGSHSLCAQVYDDPPATIDGVALAPNPAQTVDRYQMLAPLAAGWSCPYSASTVVPTYAAPGYPSPTLLDLVICAYNEGTARVFLHGIVNPHYVAAIERQI